MAAAADALDALEVARTTVDVGEHHVLRLAVDRHVGDRGRAGVDLAAGQQQQRRGEQDGGAHWDLLAGVAMARAARTNGSSGRRACHMLRNRAMTGWQTASDTGRCLSRIVPRPLSSRAIDAIALRLTIDRKSTRLNSSH